MRKPVRTDRMTYAGAASCALSLLGAASCALINNDFGDAGTVVDAGAPERNDDVQQQPETSGCSNVDTSNDTHNCGYCNHDCLGGVCLEGACQPVAIVTDQLYPRVVTVDDANVYWLGGLVPDLGSWFLSGSADRSQAVGQVPKDGSGAPVMLFTRGANIPLMSIGVDSASVYASYFTSVFRMTKGIATDGGLPPVAFRSDIECDTNVLFVLDEAGDAGTFYFRTGGPPGVFSLRAGATDDGGPPHVSCQTGISPEIHQLATPGIDDMYWTAIAQDAAHVFYVQEYPDTNRPTGIYQVDKDADGGAPLQLSPIFATQLATDGSYVYYTDGWNGDVGRVKVGSATTEIIASGQYGPWGVATDGGLVYWTNSLADEVLSCNKVGCARPRVVADRQADPHGIAVDDKAIYWANMRGGTIMRLAK